MFSFAVHIHKTISVIHASSILNFNKCKSTFKNHFKILITVGWVPDFILCYSNCTEETLVSSRISFFSSQVLSAQVLGKENGQKNFKVHKDLFDMLWQIQLGRTCILYSFLLKNNLLLQVMLWYLKSIGCYFFFICMYIF